MKKFKILCLFFLFFGLLTGCSEENSKYKLERVEDYTSVVKDEFHKEFYLYFSYETAEVYIDKENNLVEYRIFYPMNNENYLIRVKKVDQYEDITDDLNIKWTIKEEQTQGILNGVTGEGTVKLKYLNNKSNLFKGEMWFDSEDQMMYAILSIGENSLKLDANVIFNPGYFVEVDLNSYEEADEFLKKYSIDQLFFYREEGINRTQVARETDDSISLFIGEESNYISKRFYSNGHVLEWTRETNPETGNFIETHNFKEENHMLMKSEYTKDNLCIYAYSKNFDTNDVSEIKYDLSGMVTYEFHENVKEYMEIHYTEKDGSMKYIDKNSQTKFDVTFKKITTNGIVRRHYLTIESDYYSKVFTYVSDESVILTKYEAKSKVDGEHVIWTFNGKGNEHENMITCVRTYNGSTKTYTFDTVPWGTGMLYPPSNPGEFYF